MVSTLRVAACFLFCAGLFTLLFGIPHAAESQHAKDRNDDDAPDTQEERDTQRMLEEAEAQLAQLLAEREQLDEQIERLQDLVDTLRDAFPSFRYARAATLEPDFRRGGTLRLAFGSRVERVTPYVSMTANAATVLRAPNQKPMHRAAATQSHNNPIKQLMAPLSTPLRRKVLLRRHSLRCKLSSHRGSSLIVTVPCHPLRTSQPPLR